MKDNIICDDVTFYLANLWANSLMWKFNVSYEGKWYVEPLIESISVDSMSDILEFLKNIIRKSAKLIESKDGSIHVQKRHTVEYWTPVIKYKNIFLYDSRVKIISDGNFCMFMNESGGIKV